MLPILIFFCVSHLVDADGVKTVFGMEGDSVTLHTDISNLPEYPGQEYIKWVFEPDDSLIIGLYVQTGDITHYKNDIFRDRVQIDSKTASLTLSNTQITDSGLYNMYGSLINESFNVTIYSHLPNPVITRDSTCSSPSSVSKCVLLCSVSNVSDVWLSWYKGNSSLSSISVSDLSSSVSLHLEVDYQDNDTYSCVLGDCFTIRTEHLDTSNLCLTHQDCVPCCGYTEALVRLVISAVVAVAIVAIVVYDITSRRAENK